MVDEVTDLFLYWGICDKPVGFVLFCWHPIFKQNNLSRCTGIIWYTYTVVS